MKRKLVFYGNETLRQTAEKITNIDQKTIDLIETMFNIMYRERGFGLAAPQIDIPQRLIGLDIESYEGPSMALINPEIQRRSEEMDHFEEGCLSLPGISADILRPAAITVKGVTAEGKDIVFDADGLLARVLQHEIDPLDGRLFIDYLEGHVKKEICSELKKIKKLNHHR